jgi:outer membrane protein assembly factor BamE (lipoprotein component of BamABCDE complex)
MHCYRPGTPSQPQLLASIFQPSSFEVSVSPVSGSCGRFYAGNEGRTHLRYDLRQAEVLALACALLAAAAGCVTSGKHWDSNISKLRIGMSREQVRTVMGVPRVVETVGQVEFWLYFIDTQERAAQDIPDDERNIGKVGFVNGRVTGWGESYYNDAIKGIITANGSTTKEN